MPPDTRRPLRALVLILLVLFCAHTASADLTIYVQPVDSITRMDLRDSEVLVFMPGDTAVVAEGQTETARYGLLQKVMKSFNLPHKDAAYTLYIDAPGYEPRRIAYRTSRDMDPYAYNTIGEVGLLRTPKKLDEVTVTATKIKMYYKGDTIIYNADAFLLPDGSMLDDLIRKLPGVSINRNGEIFSNGRKIESLQLEGRKLFDGNPRTLLENLGAYTVNKIKIYEQDDDREKFLGYGDRPEKALVMNVNLKKEYSIGKWLNIDAGYGTSDRYLGRGFFLGFTKSFAMTAFINANNLSAAADPGRYDYWTTDKVGASESSYLSGGISYQYDGKAKVNGNVTAHSSDKTARSGRESVNFIPSGDTYERQFAACHGRSFALITDHRLIWQHRAIWLDIKPRFNYSHSSGDNSDISATFNEDPGSIAAAEIEAIYSGSEEQLRRALINRRLAEDKYNASNMGGRLSAVAVVRLPDGNRMRHNLTFSAGGNYGTSRRNNFNRYSINYGAEATPSIGEYAFTRSHPAYSLGVNASALYEINFRGRHTVSITYSFNHNNERSTNDRYLLSDLENAALESLKFGQEPPEDLLPGVIDPVNSNHATYRGDQHSIDINSRFAWGERNLDNEGARGSLLLFVRPSLKVLNRQYDFHKVAYDTLAARSFVLPQGSFNLNYGADSHEDSRHYFASVGWDSSPQLFAMSNLIDVENNSDPLNIFRGNPHLRNAYAHHAGLKLQYSKTRGSWQQHHLNFDYSFVTDAIVSGVVYNSATGVRTQSMHNVDGNRNIELSYGGNGDICKWENRAAKGLSYNIGLRGYDNRSVSLIGSGAEMPQKAFIFTRGFSPRAGLNFSFGSDHTVGISFSGGFSRYSGDNMEPFSASTLSYRLNAAFCLPANFRISTNLTLFSRRGYADSSLNSDQYVWNASASWHWKKARLTVTLDGYDLLHQIQTVTRYVDAQGRSETWSNTLPRYAMLRIRYHLDLSPK